MRILPAAALAFGLAANGLPAAELTFPPQLPGGEATFSHSGPEFLARPENISAEVAVATTPPRVDFYWAPGQTYAGKPWSAWGDSLFAGGKYYFSLGDHQAPVGNTFVYEFDPATQKFRQLLDLRKLLALPEGHYTPGKIHSRLSLGRDGWLYACTHRGSTRATTDANHFSGDWIVRCQAAEGRAEVVAHAPVAKHCLPTGFLDGERMKFYASTHPGDNREGDIRFLAYDIGQRRVECEAPDGPPRAFLFAASTGRVYFMQGQGGQFMRYESGPGAKPQPLSGGRELRAASDETADGRIFTVSQGGKGLAPELAVFDTRQETFRSIGSAAVGSQGYITSLDADRAGRFVYYVPGAHGGAASDGSPVVQFDTASGRKKVLAFLHPYFSQKIGCTLVGTYSVALAESGDRLFITWNCSRGGKAWDSCAVTVIHIPPAERGEATR